MSAVRQIGQLTDLFAVRPRPLAHLGHGHYLTVYRLLFAPNFSGYVAIVPIVKMDLVWQFDVPQFGPVE